MNTKTIKKKIEALQSVPGIAKLPREYYGVVNSPARQNSVSVLQIGYHWEGRESQK
jgi:hypothetical protein